MEAAAEPHGRPGGEDELRRLRSLLEARQRHLRARIAACEELTAEMAALQAALGADCRPPCVSSGLGSGEGRRAEAGRAPRPGPRRPAPAPRPPALPRSLTRPAPGPAAASSELGGEGDAEPCGASASGGPARERPQEPAFGGPRSGRGARGTDGLCSVAGSGKA